MKKILFLLGLLFPLMIMGQSYRIKGVVKDSLTGETEPYATIRILKKPDLKKPVKMLVTDDQGTFVFELKVPGDYLFSLTSVGRHPLVRDFKVLEGQENLDMGVLLIRDDVEQLGEVVVKARKQLVKNELGKLTYSVAEDPDSRTSNALDMLRKVPRVTVDGEDNIRLNGSTNYRIYINGKPSNLLSNNPGQILKSMPASSVRNVEVISDPGAKYDAEGVGGIINIVMGGKGLEGIMATLNAGVNSFGANGGVYASARTGKFSMSANYGYQYLKAPANRVKTEREDLQNTARKYLFTENDMRQRLPLQYGVIEASYEIDTLNLVTLSGNLYGGNVKAKFNSHTWMNTAEGREVYGYRQNGKGNTDIGAQALSVDYQHTARRNRQELLTFSYRLDRTPKNFGSYYHLFDFTGDDPYVESISPYQNRDNKASTNEHTFQADYVNPFGKMHTLEAGLKYIYRNNKSNGNYWVRETEEGAWEPDPWIRKEDYKHLQHILAAYTSYGIKYKKVGLKAGVRVEHTAQKVRFRTGSEENFDSDFTDIVPSALFSWQPSMFRNVQLTYNMRISRPGITYLNPFRQMITPSDITYGNSDLKSEKNHTLSLSFSSFSQKFNVNLSARYSFTNNSINEYQFIDENGVLNTTYGNIGNNQLAGITAFVNWNASAATRLYVNGDLRYESYKSGNKGDYYKKEWKNDGMTGSIYVGAQQNFTHGFRLSANGGYFLPSISLQSKGMKAYYYSLGLNKSFFKERLNLALTAANFLEKHRTYKSTTSTPYLHTVNRYRTRVQTFAFNISWRFGNLSEKVKKASRSIRNDDVKNLKEDNGMNSSTGNQM